MIDLTDIEDAFRYHIKHCNRETLQMLLHSLSARESYLINPAILHYLRTEDLQLPEFRGLES